MQTRKALYAEFALARESATVVCALVETKAGRGVGKPYRVKKGTFPVDAVGPQKLEEGCPGAACPG